MWSPSMPIRVAAIVAGAAFAVVGGPAASQEVRGIEPYGAAYGADYGYAGELVRGTYVGAPFTSVPRPSQLVPSPWSYGTYGVPTVSGLPAAPAGLPTLTVIESEGSASARRHGAGPPRSEPGAGVRVVAVRVPRR